MASVFGNLVDEHTRCVHWSSPLDIIAIKFKCCEKFYACSDCHATGESHAPNKWPAAEFSERAVLCGMCNSTISITQYLKCDSACPSCSAPFNPGCSRHRHLYFEAEPAEPPDASTIPGPPVRWGVIGTNFITDQFISAGRVVPGFVLASIYSRTKSRASEYAAAQRAPDANVFDSVEEMAASGTIDAVYVASPTSLHAKYSIAFLSRGIHVMCEKPAMTNAAELARVLAAAKAHGATFMEAMRPAFTPNMSKVRQIVISGELGPVRHFLGSFSQLSSRYPAYLRGDAQMPSNQSYRTAASWILVVMPFSLQFVSLGPRHRSATLFSSGEEQIIK